MRKFSVLHLPPCKVSQAFCVVPCTMSHRRSTEILRHSKCEVGLTGYSPTPIGAKWAAQVPTVGTDCSSNAKFPLGEMKRWDRTIRELWINLFCFKQKSFHSTCSSSQWLKPTISLPLPWTALWPLDKETSGLSVLSWHFFFSRLLSLFRALP